MTDDKARNDRATGSPANEARQDRLKLALRENLKRRKAQVRGRSDLASDPSVAPSGDTDASLDHSNEEMPRR